MQCSYLVFVYYIEGQIDHGHVSNPRYACISQERYSSLITQVLLLYLDMRSLYVCFQLDNLQHCLNEYRLKSFLRSAVPTVQCSVSEHRFFHSRMVPKLVMAAVSKECEVTYKLRQHVLLKTVSTLVSI